MLKLADSLGSCLKHVGNAGIHPSLIFTSRAERSSVAVILVATSYVIMAVFIVVCMSESCGVMRVSKVISICARQAKHRYLRIHPNANYGQSVQSLRLSITLSLRSTKVAYRGTYSIIRMIALATSGCDIN